MSKISNMSDRDLLVMICTEIEGIKEDIKTVTPEVKQLEQRVTKIETRNASNIKFVTFIIGIVSSCMTLVVKYFIDLK